MLPRLRKGGLEIKKKRSQKCFNYSTISNQYINHLNISSETNVYSLFSQLLLLNPSTKALFKLFTLLYCFTLLLRTRGHRAHVLFDEVR